MLVWIATPIGADAECDGPFPSFRNAAPSAQRIVFGQVTSLARDPGEPTDGRFAAFILEGWSVLDGDRQVTIEVRDLQSQPCAGWVVARPGDAIAIAFDGRDFTPPQVVNAVAWLDGVPPALDGIEVVTVAEVHDLAGVQMPDLLPGLTGRPPPPEPPVALVVALLMTLVLGMAFTWRRLTR